MSEHETIEEFIQNLPGYFGQLRPLFSPNTSQSLYDRVARIRALGPDPVLEAAFKVWEARLAALPATEPGTALRKALKTEINPAEFKAALRPRQYDPAKLMALAQKATSDARSATIFRDAVDDLLGRRELPPEIQPSVRALVSDVGSKPKKKRGQSAEANAIRDRLIGLAVEALVENGGYRPTRNRASRLRGSAQEESACSIVTKALAEAGIHLSEDAVEKIWKAHRRKALRQPNPSASE